MGGNCLSRQGVSRRVNDYDMAYIEVGKERPVPRRASA
jgi:hypothetical protein